MKNKYFTPAFIIIYALMLSGICNSMFAQSNTDCSGAILLDINDPDCITGNTENTIFSGTPASCATDITGSPLNVTGSRWYKYDPPTTVDLMFRTNAAFNDIVTVYRGNSCAGLVEVACSNKDEFGFTGETVYAQILGGETCYIRITGSQAEYGKDSGDFCLEFSAVNSFPEVPPNDLCSNAILLGINQTCVNGTNSYAGFSGFAPSGFPLARADVWYSFVPNSDGLHLIESHAKFSEVISLYSGNCETLTELASTDVGQVLETPLLTSGQTYYIQICGVFASVEGDFCITVQEMVSPVAAFTENTTEVCEGGTVQFFDQSTGYVTSWNWTFPGGTPSSSTAQNPVVTYTSSGSYDVTLQVSNANGTSGYYVGNYIHVGCILPCNANAGTITVSSDFVCPGQAIDVLVEGYNADPAYNQVALLVDGNGVVIESIPYTGIATFIMPPNCMTYLVYSYNSLEPPPVTGTSVECSTGCCNTSFTMLTVHDNESPVFESAPPDYLVSCFSEVPPMEELSWTDNCDGSGSVLPSEVITEDNCSYTIFRTWVYEDKCGNNATVAQTITVSDFIAPTFNVPPDATYECLSEVTPSPDIQWMDNCGTTGIMFVTQTDGGQTCPMTILRFWEAFDDCGNWASAIQVITVSDNTLPVFETPPADITVACMSDIPAPVNLGWTDNCDGSGLVAAIESTNGGSCPEIITRIWSYEDGCGNMVLTTQRATVVPATPSCSDFVLDACSVDSQTEVDSIFATWQNDYLASLTNCYVVDSIEVQPAPDFATGGTADFSATVTNACGDVSSCYAVFSLEPCICTAEYHFTVEPVCSNAVPTFSMDPACIQGSLSSSCLDLYLYAPGGIPSLAPAGFDPLASLNGIGTWPLNHDGLIFETFVGNLTGVTICDDLAGLTLLDNPGDQPVAVSYFILPWVDYLNGNNDNLQEYNNIHPGACPILRYDVVVSPDTSSSCISCSTPDENAILDTTILLSEKMVDNQSGYISDVNVHIDLDHTWVGDLLISLEHNGVVVPLFGSSCAKDNISATFDDQATTIGNTLCEDSIAVSGFVVPQSALSSFNGIDPNGSWVLYIEDYFVLDNGTLNYWCLDIETQSCPDSLTLYGMESNNVIDRAGNMISSSQTVVAPAHVQYSAGGQIELLPGFEVQAGAEFEARMEGCVTTQNP